MKLSGIDPTRPVGLDNPPPLPEYRYRQQLKWALKKFRAKNRIGFLTLAKKYLIPLILEEAGDNEAGFGDYLDAAKVRRKLEYWCGEEGDVKDEVLLYAIGHMLERYAPALLKEFRYIPYTRQTAQAIAEFVSWMPKDELRIKTIDDQIDGRRQIRPGIYKRYHHNLNPIAKGAFPAVFGYFVSISDIGEKDFYLCNFFSLLPPFVDIATRYSGFLFHKSPNKIILTRSLIRDDTSPLQIDIAHLQYFGNSGQGDYVKIDDSVIKLYEATIIHHAYISTPCNAIMGVGKSEFVGEYDLPVNNWRFDHLIRFKNERVQEIADAVKWDI